MIERKRQRGSAMLITMIIIAALLAGAAVLVSMQMSSSRSTELTRNGLAALYCAEAGLAAARSVVTSNYGAWDAALTGNCADSDCASLIEPGWLSAISHDLDGDLISDFALYVRDNDDDAMPQDYDSDEDDTVFIVARCTKYPDSPRQVEELINHRPAMNQYRCQLGDILGQGNDNNHTLDTCDGN